MTEKREFKNCPVCKEEKRLEEFHTCNQNKDNRQWACRSCISTLQGTDYRDSHRRASKAYYHRNKQAIRDKIANRYHVDPEFRREVGARRKLAYHVSKGHIEKEPCVVCGNTVSAGHHDDYSLALDVTWLCTQHHKQFHHLPSLGIGIADNSYNLVFNDISIYHANHKGILTAYAKELCRVSNGDIYTFVDSNQLSNLLGAFKAQQGYSADIITWKNSHYTEINGYLIYASQTGPIHRETVKTAYSVFSHNIIDIPRVLLEEMIHYSTIEGDRVFDMNRYNPISLLQDITRYTGRSYIG